MELTEKERELLKLYRVHKKNKRKKFLISSFLVLILSGSLYAGYKYIYEPSKKSVAKMEEQVEKVDRTAPLLILSKKSIELIHVNDIRPNKLKSKKGIRLIIYHMYVQPKMKKMGIYWIRLDTRPLIPQKAEIKRSFIK